MCYTSRMSRLLLFLTVFATVMRAEQTVTVQELNQQAQKYERTQKTINAVRANPVPKKTIPTVLNAEESKAAAERAAFQRLQQTPDALRARCPQGLLIVNYSVDQGVLRVRLKNITASPISVDGTELRAMVYDTGLVHEGGSTSGTSLSAGETREFRVGMIGNSRRVGALTWKGVDVWSAPSGEVFSSGEAAISVQRAAAVAASVQARSKSLVQVKDGYVPSMAASGSK